MLMQLLCVAMPALTNRVPVLLQVWEERDREFVAAGDLTMDDDCLILLIDADTKVGHKAVHMYTYMRMDVVANHVHVHVCVCG
jgi:hypothetical protein